MPGDYATGGTALGAQPPCSLISVNQQAAQDAADDVTFSAGNGDSFEFTYAGAAQEIFVDPVDVGGGADGPDGDNNETGGGITSNTAVYGEYFPQDTVFQAATGSPETVGITWSTTGKWDPEFYCVNDGTVYDWGDSVDGTNVPQPTVCGQETFGPCNGAGNLSDCFTQSGIGLSPASWVPGLWQMGTCVLEWLFIPGSAQIAGLTNLFSSGAGGTGGGSSTPGVWIGSLTTFAVGFPSTAVGQIQTAADGSSCTGVTVPIDGHNLSTCDALASAGTTTSWSLVDSIVTAIFLVLIGLALFHLLRRAITGNSA